MFWCNKGNKVHKHGLCARRQASMRIRRHEPRVAARHRNSTCCTLRESSLFLETNRELCEQEYMPTKHALQKNANVHIGQRELLLCETQFLTSFISVSEFSSGCVFCVYAGAAPGVHIAQLLDMFPRVRMLLVDPRFDSRPGRHPDFERHMRDGRVALLQGVFDDALVQSLWGYFMHGVAHTLQLQTALDALRVRAAGVTLADSLFISDVRDNPFDESGIMVEMHRQQRWFCGLGARGALLKFRLPFVDELQQPGAFVYGAGDILLPVYGPRSTTECRLVLRRGFAQKVYDVLRHERVMAFFNQTYRARRFRVFGREYDSFDAAAAALVMHLYLDKFRHARRSELRHFRER